MLEYNLNKKTLAILGLILLAMLCIFKDHLFNKPKTTTETFDNNKPTFRMFYVNWCGHCKNTKPEFKKLQQSNYKDKVNIVMIDCEENDKNAKLAEEAGVEGYPTIQLVKDNNVIPYDSGERTFAGFTNFLDNNL
tara:strand:+ start:241 stop:645 length:405 start_codon:yes stop_codon:yes gene_type:complete